ncbi:MAG TPA: TVP38/TMEM64 family protein [Caulobacteraceae bacterium]|nr:TVP38/TMEM64 family protein [Caulobacteraceae bacterium]
MTSQAPPSEPPPPATAGELVRRWAPLVLMVLAGVAVYASGLYRYVTFDALRARHEDLRAFVDAHFLLGLVLYACLFTATTFVAVPGASVLQLVAGFLFGPLVGGVATAVSATLGSLGYYGAARTALGEPLRRKAYADPRARRWREGLEKDAFWYLLGLRVPPVMLFVAISALAGVAAVPWRSYLAATFLGVLPSAIVYASIGAGLDGIFTRGERIDPFHPTILWPMVALGVLSLIPATIKLVGTVRRRTRSRS